MSVPPLLATPTHETAALIERVGWAAGMYFATLFGPSPKDAERYADVWRGLDVDAELVAGAVHFADMARDGFYDEIHRVAVGEARPQVMKYCHQAGAAMAVVDPHQYDQCLHDQIAALTHSASDFNSGTWLAAASCGETFPQAVVDALHDHAVVLDDQPQAVRLALLGSQLHFDTLSGLLGVDDEELEQLIGSDDGVERGTFGAFLTQSGRAQTLGGIAPELALL